jgi:Na+/phosphate symporter
LSVRQFQDHAVLPDTRGDPRADIGTTVTVQILAFNVLDYSILLIGLGLLAMYWQKARLEGLGQAILGFGSYSFR